ncbi:MAG: ABC transporter ATP-binding protein [Thermoanaerobaculia bacterium]
MSSPLFAARAAAKSYELGETEVVALAGVDLEIAAGEFVAIAGPSGSGKSTLLHLLGALDSPDTGSVAIAGRDLATLSERERTLLRRRRLGFVFQSFHLVPVLSALENVEYPLWIDDVPAAERRERARGMLESVGLGHRLDHLPDRLSGGERQRVAIARALVHRPAAILADEPTGNLDSANGAAIFELMLAVRREHGTTFVLATHDPTLMAHSPRRIELRDGRIVSDTAGPGDPAKGAGA